ncbi:hypothetical protein ACJX0J_017714, partial [Zea mays]
PMIEVCISTAFDHPIIAHLGFHIFNCLHKKCPINRSPNQFGQKKTLHLAGRGGLSEAHLLAECFNNAENSHREEEEENDDDPSFSLRKKKEDTLKNLGDVSMQILAGSESSLVFATKLAGNCAQNKFIKQTSTCTTTVANKQLSQLNINGSKNKIASHHIYHN